MACIKSFAQDAGIDTIVTANEGKVATIFQKMEKSSIESTGHGKNPKFVSSIYSFTDDKLLNSATDIVFFSIGDTSFIINYYFDSGQLIKVKTIIFDNNKHPDKDILYFNNNKVISEESELAGLKNPRYYLNRAKELIKKLKRKPIRFPE